MTRSNSERLPNILLVGSSHTNLFFLSVKSYLERKAHVSKLPYHAGNTNEMLTSLPRWPLEDSDIVHFYGGHRDLMPNEDGQPIINPKEFKYNLSLIIRNIRARTTAKIILSNIPYVSEQLLELDPQRNQRIASYNKIIEEVAAGAGIPVHDFQKFVASHRSGKDIYTDGLHFTRKFYKDFGVHLATYLANFL